MRGVCTIRPHPQVSSMRRRGRKPVTSAAATATPPSTATMARGDMRAIACGVSNTSQLEAAPEGAGRRPRLPTAPPMTVSRGIDSTASTGQATARMPMPARIGHPASCARPASGERGMARNAVPNALTDVAAARPPVRASAPTPSVSRMATDARGLATPGRKDWKSSHSLTKPLKGGSAAIESAPTRNAAAVHGIRLIRPPRRLRSRSPVACSTAPAPRKSRLLNAAWFTTCSRPAVNARAAASGWLRLRNTKPAPRPSVINPTFSTVEYASRRFKSSSTSA